MKKSFISLTLVFVMLLTFVPLISANSSISVYLNNEKIIFDVEPRLIDGRTMVPMRAIFEKLGATVTWDAQSNTAHAYRDSDLKGVSVTIGLPYMINMFYEIFPLDVPAMEIDGRTLVPLRAVSEAFDCTVNWDGGSSTVSIYSEDFVDLSQATETQEVITVSTATELINNIGSNRKLVLTSKYYNLSTVKNVFNDKVTRQEGWDGLLDSFSFKHIVNLTIEGNAEIVVDDLSASVLSFENCGLITLSGLTVGHTNSFEQYSCEGPVVSLSNCDGVEIKNCNLFGCGAVGVSAGNTKNLNISQSKIYDCTYSGIWLSESVANVIQSKFFDCNLASGVIRCDNSTIVCNDCDFYRLSCEENLMDSFNDSDKTSNFTFNDCRFSDNSFDNIINYPEYSSESSLIFTNCLFENTDGFLDNYQVKYVGCTLK